MRKRPTFSRGGCFDVTQEKGKMKKRWSVKRAQVWSENQPFVRTQGATKLVAESEDAKPEKGKMKKRWSVKRAQVWSCVAVLLEVGPGRGRIRKRSFL